MLEEISRKRASLNRFTFASFVENASFSNAKTETTETCLWSPMAATRIVESIHFVRVDDLRRDSKRRAPAFDKWAWLSKDDRIPVPWNLKDKNWQCWILFLLKQLLLICRRNSPSRYSTFRVSAARNWNCKLEIEASLNHLFSSKNRKK